MVIEAVATIALYCQRCGKLELHDVSYFSAIGGSRALKCGCGHLQAMITRTEANHYVLEIHCCVCQSTHKYFFKGKKLRHTKMEKIYCAREKFELGYVGDHRAIAEMFAYYKHQFAAINGESDEVSDARIENQRIVLGVLNKIHDIAEQGGVYCRCGSSAIKADLLTEGVLLGCLHCGGRYFLPAQTERDLADVNALQMIELSHCHRLDRRIKLD